MSDPLARDRLEAWLPPLRRLHARIRDAVVASCEQSDLAQLSTVAEDAEGDTLYAIDRVGEALLVEAFDDIARDEPLYLVAEGLAGAPLLLPRDARPEDARWRVIVDPIDGTRGLMYQKRSAWILTGVAPERGPDTSLRDVVVALQTEIPLVKQHLSDQLWCIRGEPVGGERFDRIRGHSTLLRPRPSSATTIAHGFAAISRFFPGGRELLAAIDDEMVENAIGPPIADKAQCFEDQYPSSAGQLYELAMGHDRFVGDLRPLLAASQAARGRARPVCCHPYDLCTALIAEAAGVELTDAAGEPLDAPLDLTTNVAWLGYANPAIRAEVEPALRRALRARGLPASRGGRNGEASN